MRTGVAPVNFWPSPAHPRRPRLVSVKERYALRVEEAGAFLGLAGDDQQIREVELPELAHQFSTHQGALRVARELAAAGRRVNVVKIL